MAPALLMAIMVAQPALSQTYSLLYGFSAPPGEGQHPNGLVEGTDGNFYGTTTYGPTFLSSAGGAGTIFRITPSGTLTTLHVFSFSGPEGALPYAGLVQGTDGNFYGTTCFGPSSESDANGPGTVFRITPAGTLTTLHVFSGSDGRNPSAGLVQGSDGSFYGTTYFGGPSDFGTVFKITPAGVLTTLYSFSWGYGQYPFAGLVQGTDGNFYGTTSQGGASSYGYGTVFRITPAGALTTLYSFSGDDGQGPFAGLVQGADGSFYGTTERGGASEYGTVFKITPAGILTTLYSFSGGDGQGPSAGLVKGTDGNFFGTTSAGGPGGNGTVFGYGTVFQITATGTLTTLHLFSGGDGQSPQSSLVQATGEGTGGSFYGTTVGGGPGYGGVVFRLSLPPAPPCSAFSAGVSPSGVGSVTVNTGQNCAGGYTQGPEISLPGNIPAG